MTVQLSPHKVSRILRDYFDGLSQTKIAKKAGVDQSSISHYAGKFKETAAECGKVHFKSLAVGENPAKYVAVRTVDDLMTHL